MLYLLNVLRRNIIVVAVAGFFVAGLFASVSLLPVLARGDQASPHIQVPIHTPTPFPDGRIIYIVKKGDTLLSISLTTGVPVEELRGMNNLVNDVILVGQELLLGFGGPPEAGYTPGPTPTTTPLVPTPTPQPGTGNLCILLFDDVNGDSLRQEEEPSIPGGAISIDSRDADVSETVDTGSGYEPHCFEYLPEGLYTISVAVPPGYNPTTNTSYQVELGAGDITYIGFGAQPNSETLAEAPIIPQEGEKSPILGIIGGVILLVGLVLALFAGRILKGR